MTPDRPDHTPEESENGVLSDTGSLETAVQRAGDDLAGIVVSAFKHDFGKDQEMPDAAFARRVRELCDANDAALIVDDVRAGFRLTMRGSWDLVGVQPDLSAWSKAIANGHALAAVTGNDRYREAASKLYVTGSFWCSAVPMAAASGELEIVAVSGDVSGRLVSFTDVTAGDTVPLVFQVTAGGTGYTGSATASLPRRPACTSRSPTRWPCSRTAPSSTSSTSTPATSRPVPCAPSWKRPASARSAKGSCTLLMTGSTWAP